MKLTKAIFGIAALGASVMALHGQGTLEDVNSGAKADLRSALQRLSEARATIREESVPLSREINERKLAVRDLRDELDRERRAQDSRSLSLDALEQRASAVREENEYLSGLMGQFMQELQTQMTAAEQQKHAREIDEIRIALESADVSPEDQYAARIDGVRMGLERLRERIGGAIYEGQAIAGNGDLQSGRFVELGPISVFVNDAGTNAGIVESHHADIPAAIPLHAAFVGQVAKIASEGAGELEIDVTLGAALAIEGAKESVVEHVVKGGLWVYPILLFGALAAALAAYKLVSIYRIKQPRASELGVILRSLREGRSHEALAAAEKLPWEFGPMIAEAVKRYDQDKELVEEVMYEKMLEAQPKVERFLSVIAVTAAVAPLLGLLGTVTGMINTFTMITLFGTGDASALSGGISEALITTELGLVVAIPALVAHAMLNRKAQAILAQMEKLAVVFVNGLPRRREELAL